MKLYISHNLPVPAVLVPADVPPNGDVCADVPKRPVCGPVADQLKKKKAKKSIFYFSFWC